MNSGYDLFNENDSFYNDICTPYKSENGTDVLLNDRKNDYFNNNETTCQANCSYSNFNIENQYLKCECNIVTEEKIDTVEPEKFNGKIIYKSFYEVLKYSNFKVLKCYKLVFDLNSLFKNYGSIIIICYFLIYLFFLFIFIIKGISPIEIEISNILSKKELNAITNNNAFNTNIKADNSERKAIQNNKNNKKDRKSLKKLTKIDIKRNNMKISKTYKKINNKNIKENEIINKSKKKNKTIRHKKNNFPPKRKSSKKNLFNKNTDKANDDTNRTEKKPKTNNLKYNSKQLIISNFRNIYHKRRTIETSKNVFIYNDNSINKRNITSDKFTSKKEEENEKEKEKKEKLSDFELNDLEYFEALELDKRPFSQIYWSILRREHLILFTFFSWNDYNIIYVKFARFIFLIATDMAMNAIFFSDDSMHKIYLNYGQYDFIQQIPQIIYSTIISQLLELIICYLSLTDKHYYQIKSLKFEKENKILVFRILRCIK